jgi:LmbE family N-acetylglucosaminyl deacetylase
MRQLNAAEIEAGLQQLNVKGSVLYLAAHPDDENTRLLAYLAKEMKVRTGYLSLTRGDGGQNLIGNEQAELLGLIRTQELLAARQVDGAAQFFTRANDFGFSKTSEESFEIWGKEQILADAVWVIRKFRPDVIITRFPEDARAGHGHHAGSAIIAREAFFAAADPKRFPEQLKYVRPWQAKRILWNTFNFGGTNTTAPDQLKIDVGLYNPLLGKSYGEIAAISRTNHKSQGFGSTLQRGEAFEYFSHVAGEPAKNSIFDGLNIALDNKAATQLIQNLQSTFEPSFPAKSVGKLINLKKLLPDQKLIDELILACAGIWLDVAAKENAYAVGDSVALRIQLINRSNLKVVDFSTGRANPTVLEQNRPVAYEQLLGTTAADLTQPYWLKSDHPIGQFNITKQEEVGHPENPSALTYTFKLSIEGEQVTFELPIVYKFTDPIRGEIYQPLILGPRITATLTEKSYIFTSAEPKTVAVQLKSFKQNSVGFVQPQLPKGWKSSPEKIAFNLARKGDEQTINFSITPGKDTQSGVLHLQVNTDGVIDDKGLKTISYEHIPTVTIFPQAKARLEKIDVKIAGKRIAYIDGAGDLVAEALKQMGYEVTHLTPFQVINNDLSTYDAIVTGVRLYNINDDIKLMQPKLMAYVQNGGTLVSQYNVNNGLKLPNLGPYPFKLINKRVTEEAAKVTFLAPNDPALNYPNQITQKDFDGWIQERGIYFASDIDQKYTPILGMNDTGESSSDGSLLVANYGKGKYVYTSLVFFRELPAGVPGAYRLFANLLAAKQP